jgi:hypothetical protein
MIMWQCSGLLAPHTTQQAIPRNTSRLSSPVLNAVVVDISDSGQSDQPYPEGGAFGRRGSWNVGRVIIMANTARECVILEYTMRPRDSIFDV